MLDFFVLRSNKQLGAIFNWLSERANGDDLILVLWPWCKGYFKFDLPFKFGDKPRKVNAGKEPTFVICELGQRPLMVSGEHWVKIFNTPFLEVWESKKNKLNRAPLRWGLSAEERNTAFSIARDSIEKFFLDKADLKDEYFHKLPACFNLKTDLCVAIWIRGQLRGSIIRENSPLGRGISEGAVHACRDQRFKPVTVDELSEARIEITIIPNLKVPLSKKELAMNAIFPKKGYLVKSRGKSGWFLPEVFNAKRFRGLREFLETLSEEKAKLSPKDYLKGSLYIFNVYDFIESEDRQSSLELSGPIVKKESLWARARKHPHDLSRASNSGDSGANLLNKFKAAADWLCRMQEPDGNIPPIINAFSGQKTQIDWPRLAFTLWALAEFGAVNKNNEHIEAARIGYNFIKQFLLGDFISTIPHPELTLAYAGQLAIALGQKSDAENIGSCILRTLNTGAGFDAIKYAQTASLLKLLKGGGKNFDSVFDQLARFLKDRFLREVNKGKDMNLALWAELVNVFYELDQQFADEMNNWLKSYQMSNGSFQESTGSSFAYSRGTGKIFEVLALNQKENGKAIKNCLTWILNMQYDGDNMYFVKQHIRPELAGAFRHDYFNTEAWIDAAGHVLLGASRLDFEALNYGDR